MQGFQVVQCLWVLIFAAALSGCTKSNPAAEDAGATAARSWLEVVDAGDYGASWAASAERFQDRVPRTEWVEMVSKVREPLGELRDRRLSTTKFATALPGAPDGEYVICVFEASYTQKAAAIETVTTVKEGNGEWHVTGYFIR